MQVTAEQLEGSEEQGGGGGDIMTQLGSFMTPGHSHGDK